MLKLPRHNNSSKVKALFLAHLAREERESKKSAIIINDYRGSNAHFATNDFGTVRFYEWSNLATVPKLYHSRSRFLEYLKANNINITKVQEMWIKNSPQLFAYASCPQGMSTLCIETSLPKLRTAMKEMEDKKPTLNQVIKESKKIILP